MKTINIIIISAITLFTFNACVFNDNVANDPIPYSSDQIKFNNLVAKISFENNVIDEKNNIQGGTSTGTYVDGIKGKAYKGSDGNFVSFNNAGSISSLSKAFTYAVWIKLDQPITSNAQCIYMLPQTNAFWGNAFLLLDSTSDPNKLRIKVHFESESPDSEQWIENMVGDNYLIDVIGEWVHVTWTYNGVSSKYFLYVNGQLITSALGVNCYDGDMDLGFIHFQNVDKFIIGGFQQHLGVGNPSTPEPWMKTFTGAIDEFRIYDTDLTAEDIFRLYSIEKMGL